MPLPPALSQGFRRIGRGALDALLPPVCAACEARVSEQGQLCAACFARISFIGRPFCDCCGVPFASDMQAGTGELCPSCTAQRPLFRHARAALRYDAGASGLILPLKHGDRAELVPALAAMMARAGATLLAGADVLVPVPLHRARLRQRRYNQSALLAFAIGKRAERKVVADGLRRLRRTVPLDDKSPEDRAREVEGAITVSTRRSTDFVNARVLLIDDVMTSGSTANACAGVLLDAGAAVVDVLTVARVPDPRLRL